jgi:hypothetical protein
MDNLIFLTTCWDILAQTLYVLLNTLIEKTLLLQKEVHVMLSCFILSATLPRSYFFTL